MGMQAHENPVTYLLYNEEARALLALLEDRGSLPYERAREEVGAHPQAFKRLTERLSSWAILGFRAPREAEFEDGRIEVVVEPGPTAGDVLPALRDILSAVRDHRDELGQWSEPLLA